MFLLPAHPTGACTLTKTSTMILSRLNLSLICRQHHRESDLVRDRIPLLGPLSVADRQQGEDPLGCSAGGLAEHQKLGCLPEERAKVTGTVTRYMLHTVTVTITVTVYYSSRSSSGKKSFKVKDHGFNSIHVHLPWWFENHFEIGGKDVFSALRWV